tara:strand:- start:1030 stop:2544 length:1515 start_codon:yes stop_codon:yes gene_type:complete
MTKLKDLTLVGAMTDADLIYISQSDTDYKATRAQIVLAVQTQLDADVATINGTLTNIQNQYLQLAGGTMTGSLILNGAPTLGLEAATKTYADGLVTALAPIASPTFTGIPAGTTAATGTNTTQLATTAFLQTELDAYLFTTTTVAAATKNLAEAESGRVDVNYTPTGTVTIGLPDSATLVSANRVSYNVNDIGNNANINNITVNTSGSDTFIGGATSYAITRDGDSIEFYSVGTIWYQNKTKISASLTEAGQIKLASSAEAIAMVEDTKAMTSAKVADVLENTVLRVQELGAASIALTESQRGLWQVSYTSTGPVSITFPDISALSSTIGTYYEIQDSGNASVNTITITAAGGKTINGLSSFTITNTRAGAYFFIDSTNNWVSKNDTETAIETVTTANPLTTLTLNIGDWDMDTDTTKTVTHGLSATEWKTIRSVNTIIRNDVDALYYKLESLIDFDGYLAGGVGDISSAKIFLNRRLLGHFDSVNFDSTSYNRGWITLEYTPD